MKSSFELHAAILCYSTQYIVIAYSHVTQSTAHGGQGANHGVTGALTDTLRQGPHRHQRRPQRVQ